MEECVDILKKLNSYLQYSWFDNAALDRESDYCVNEKEVLYSDTKFKAFCYRFTSNYTNLIAKWIKNYNDENCEYFNYWTYDRIIKNLDAHENDISQSKFMGIIRTLWEYYYDNLPKCNFKEYKMSISEFNNMKDLYDYFQNYDTLKRNINSEDNNYKKCYCSYIKEIMDVYSTLENKCRNPNGQIYCTVFNQITKENKPGTLFNDLGCNIEEVDASLVQKTQLSGTLLDLPEIHKHGSSSNTALKFTPFGKWLCNKIETIKRYFNIANEESTNGVIDRTTESKHVDTHKSKFNLSYNSIQNT
ncbi:PIR Superfamily Protein [Plasmodium ovale curtisi]|uniref:PIR Superfamily Protein n=1 Tax=Plasmodium ovale curtisi TaxID=864141 RepID=A0A1A8WIR6_PLAOA|nr:PIR Superfamily Protein [Plasmodium ovale curtisi]